MVDGVTFKCFMIRLLITNFFLITIFVTTDNKLYMTTAATVIEEKDFSNGVICNDLVLTFYYHNKYLVMSFEIRNNFDCH